MGAKEWPVKMDAMDAQRLKANVTVLRDRVTSLRKSIRSLKSVLTKLASFKGISMDKSPFLQKVVLVLILPFASSVVGGFIVVIAMYIDQRIMASKIDTLSANHTELSFRVNRLEHFHSPIEPEPSHARQ